MRIITITPETRCLSRLADFEEEFDDSRPAAELARPLLLLNQFDPSDSLHVEIRSRLERRFAERMIPIAIRNNRAMSAALAEGTTIFDYAPDSTSRPTSESYTAGSKSSIRPHRESSLTTRSKRCES